MRESVEQRNERAQEHFEELQRLIAIKDYINLLEGKEWYELKKDSLYKDLFGIDKYAELKPTWKAFTTEIVGYKTFTADWKEKVYREWIVSQGFKMEELAGVNFNKLYVSIPYLHSREAAEAILKDIRTTEGAGIGVDDLVEYLRKTYGDEKTPE